MSRFVLTAQLQLQAPNNVRQVVQQIQQQLQGVTVNVQVQNAAQAQRQIQQITQNTNQATTAAERMGKAFALSVRRFAAFSIATRAVSLFTSTLGDAVQSAIDFERQLIKVSQVTGKSIGQLRGLTKQITGLATGFGVASSDLLEVSTVLAQAGLSAEDTAVALKTLAKAALAPNFDSITETAEGAIAILAQFQEGVGSLEKQLGSINAVAGAFAVEASDLIDVIRRTGGVFKASGGDLNELLALFTSVRATTRESAESIGTGLRTIFTRIQRPKTIEFLKQFGVELTDLDGKFVGPYEAVKRLSQALAGLGEGDITFIRVAEELGGFRQIGKVLPLLQQFSTAQSALNVAMKAGDSLTQDAASAQAALAIRVMKVKEEFLALIRSVTETSTFQIMANTALSLASALIKIGDAIKPLLPMLAALAAVRLTKGLGGFFGGMMRGATSGRQYNKGGKVLGFARGGLVPGSGNRDTVPAMLSPGEFVIRKSSVNKMGAGTLAAMNENRYAAGGIARQNSAGMAVGDLLNNQKPDTATAISGSASVNARSVLTATPGIPPLGNSSLLQRYSGNAPKGQLDAIMSQALGFSSKNYQTKAEGVTKDEYQAFNNALGPAIENAVIQSAGQLAHSMGVVGASPPTFTEDFRKSLPKGLIGSLFEIIIDSFNDKPISGSESRRPFDFIGGIRPIGSMYRNLAGINYVDAKVSPGHRGTNISSDEFTKKINNQLALDVFDDYVRLITNQQELMGPISAEKSAMPRTVDSFKGKKAYFGGLIQRFATGGQVVNRGNINYLRSDIEKAMMSMGLSYDDFFKKISAPNSSFDQFMVGGIGPGSVPFPKFLKPYVAKTKAQTEMEKAQAEKAERISTALGKRGKSMRDYGDYGNRRRRFASGGGVGTDTVPALLTPGEFVINRSSAQRIGYGNLNRMNKVGKYAKGGVVQHFAAGGAATATTSSTAGIDSLDKSAKNASRSMGDVISSNKMFAASMATSLIQGFLPAVDENSSGLLKATHSLMGLVTTITSVGFALEAFGVALSANQILQLFGSGSGGLGNIMSNAFKGFKMGAGGQAGPMPLGGGLASKAGDIFGKISNVFSNLRGGLNAAGSNVTSRLGGDTLPRGFSAGLSGKSVLGGGSQSLLGNIGGFAGQAVKGVKDAGSKAYESMGLDLLKPSFNFGKQGKTLFSLSDKSVPITAKLGNAAGRFTKGFGLGSSNKFSLTDIISGQGGKAGFSGKLGGVIGKSMTGAGNLVSKIPGVGAAGRFAAGTAARFGAMGGLSGLGGAASAAAGPAAAVVGVLAAINSVVGGFRDLDGQLNKSIEAGKVEEASKLAVAKAATDFPLIGNLIGGWSETLDKGLINLMSNFGGSSLASVEAFAASQAGAVKTQKQLEEAQKTATKAMQDFENGSISASDALTKIRSASSEVVKQQQRSNQAAISNLDNRAGGITGAGRTALSYLTLGFVESSSERNARLGKQSAEQINQAAKFQSEAFQMESPARQAAIRSGIARGKDINQVRAEATGDLQKRLSQQRIVASKLQQAGDEEGAKAAFEAARQLEDQLKQVNGEIANIEKEVIRAKKSFEAMNLGLRSATATATALSAGMDRFSAGLEVGGSTFVSDVEFLQQSISSAAQAMDPEDIKSAVKNVSNNLRKFGSSEKYILKFEGNVAAFTQAQANYNKAFENIKKSIAAKDFQRLSPDALKEKMADELTKGMGSDVSDEAKKNLKDVIMNMQLSDDDVNKILGGDLSAFGDKLTEEQKKMFEDVQKIAAERAKAEQVLIDFTKKRIDAERNLVQAQQEALDLIMEGREIQAKYGGTAVSVAEKRGNLLAKSNVEGSRLGLTAMRTGDAAELRRRNIEIRGRFGGIEAGRVKQGGMEGKAGVEADATQQDLQKAYKTQIETIRGLIKLEEEQLKITQEKNKLEKESMESLVKGDVEEFFKKQAGVGATAAIASGDERLMRLYGAEALGAAALDIQRQQEAGVQELYGQRLGGTGGLAEMAAGAALSARGITDMRAAQVMAGTTGEEEASKARLRELGGMLGETGQVGVDMAEMQVQTATINVNSAQLKFNETIARGNKAAEEANRTENMPAVARRARGGLIYASRGIFVPRGTDTIPAMLTPGEFVVNRGAVNRGNNLQILQAMNNGGQSSSSNGTALMSGGGKVRYFSDGGQNGKVGSESSSMFDNMSKFVTAITTFNSSLSANIDKLTKTSITIKLDSTNVNVNINDGGLLGKLKDETKVELFQKIKDQLKVGDNGRLVDNRVGP